MTATDFGRHAAVWVLLGCSLQAMAATTCAGLPGASVARTASGAG